MADPLEAWRTFNDLDHSHIVAERVCVDAGEAQSSGKFHSRREDELSDAPESLGLADDDDGVRHADVSSAVKLAVGQ